jgi:hypothetical protein
MNKTLTDDERPDNGDQVNDQILDAFGDYFNDVYEDLEYWDKQLGGSWRELVKMHMPLEFEYISKCATAHWLYKRRKGLK